MNYSLKHIHLGEQEARVMACLWRSEDDCGISFYFFYKDPRDKT